MEKQYLVFKPYEMTTPIVVVCSEEELGATIKDYSKGSQSSIRVFEWDLNKLGLDEVEIVTEIRKKNDNA